MSGIQTGLTDAELLASQLKAHELAGMASSASEIDNIVTSGATQADLDALALSTGNLTESQVAAIGKIDDVLSSSYSFDSSYALSRYDITLSEAILAIPTNIRKRGMIVKFNNIEEYRFLNTYTEANFIKISNWIRPTNTLEDGSLNFINKKMLYRGFCFTASNNPVFHPDNSVLIIPINRIYEDGVVKPINITFAPALQNLGIMGSGQLSATLGGVASSSNYSFSNFTPNTLCNFVYINISYNNGSKTLGLAQLDTIFNGARYERYGYSDYSTFELNQGKKYITQSKKELVYLSKNINGEDVVNTFNTYFKNEGILFNGLYLYEVLRDFNFNRTFIDSAYNSQSGDLRKIYLSYLNTYGSGSGSNGTVKFKIEDAYFKDTYAEYQAVGTYNTTTGYISYILKVGSGEDAPYFTFILDFNTTKSGYIAGTLTVDNAQLNPEWILNSLKEYKEDTKEYINQFEYCRNIITSNYTSTYPVYIPPTLQARNGVKEYETIGNGSIHCQNLLIGDKKTDIQGVKKIIIDIETTRPDNSSSIPFNILKSNSGITSFDGYSATSDSEGQWIHPDICYCSSPVGGYSYWMVNSVYPFSLSGTEDAELFVSNNGVDWKRIQHPDEVQTNGVLLNIPNTELPAPSFRSKTFMPIPTVGTTMTFSTNSSDGLFVIYDGLNHDPAICYDSGYINVYITYNFNLDNSGKKKHKYRVCYRTNDGISWDIVREDGTVMPYNNDNAQLIFTKTNGVRNHIQYYYNETEVGGREVSPQIVKVSDTEFYLYSRDDSYTSEGTKFNIVRYAGTSPYTFDFSNRETTTINILYGLVWHFCIRYYNGKFYVMYDGNMATSLDGLTFINPTYPFFYRGANADLYKPSFTLGHDGVKFAQSLQSRSSSPATTTIRRTNRVEYDYVRNYTLLCSYPTLADIEDRGANLKDDAYCDLAISFTNERNNTYRTTLIAGVKVRNNTNTIKVLKGDRINIKAYCNTRGNGKVLFYGVKFE